MNHFLDAALKYAALGWQIFPLAPGQKIPITVHGVKDATTDETQIRAWWEKWPNANIAVACGEASGIYVVDVDVSASGDINGLESLKEFPTLPETVKQATPRGGFHAFYKTNQPPANRNSFRPGIDIRGNGYYVVLAPSIHPNGGGYSWCGGLNPSDGRLAEYPDFMRPVTRAPWASQNAVPVVPVKNTLPMPTSYSLQRASLYLSTVDPAIQGQGGHDKLLWAAVAMVHGFLLSEGQAYDLLVHEYNPRCVPPWDLSVQKDERDFRRKISEARKLSPQYGPGWLLNENTYTPADVSGIDVKSLIGSSGGIGRCTPETTNATVLTQQNGEIAGSTPTYCLSEINFLTRPTGLLGEIYSWINQTAIKEQPFLSLACTLAFLGTLFGRKIKDALGSRTNLYCMGIAQSSGGKAHAMNQIRRLCDAAGCTDLLGGDDIASDSAIEDRISRVESTLFLWDEIGHLLSHIKSGVSKHHAQVVSLLMKLYSAAGNVYKGKEYAENENQRTIIQPCCCIYGTSTPERFTGGISPAELQDGWLSRCLVFCAPTNPTKSRGRYESPVPPGIVEQVRIWHLRKIGDEIDGHSLGQFVTSGGTRKPPEQITIPTTTEAEKIFIDFDNETIEYGKGHPQLACLWAKGEENARRIALIVAAGESFNNPIITPSIASYTCRLMRFLLIDFGEVIVPEIVGSIVEINKRRLVTAIKEAGLAGFLKREVTFASRWADKRTRDNLLADLIEAGEVVCTEDKVKKSIRYWTAENYQGYLTNGS